VLAPLPAVIPAAHAAVDEGMNADSENRPGDKARRPDRPKVSHVTLAGQRAAVPSPDELAGLVVRIGREADRQAFAALFAFYAPRLKSFLARQGHSDLECEDIVQEAMLNVWRKAASFDPVKAGVSTWVYTIARNLGIDRRRRQRRGNEWQELTGYDEIRVRDALKLLPEEQAAVIRMTFYGEDRQTDIASTLGIPLGTVKSRVRLALARLRRAMEDSL
jgi:RNA polymerase sigma-70 factor (ECF subfamily)